MARSTALETPPATDMCAPIRIIHYKVRLKADPSFQDPASAAPVRSRHNDRMRAVSLVMLLLLLVTPRPAHAWGFSAHKFVMDRAIALLPPELRPFYEKHRAEVVERAIDPDTWIIAGWEEERPHHFVDMDTPG